MVWLGYAEKKELLEKIRLLEMANNGQKKEIERLNDELQLEKAWAEGEIEFWQEQCFNAEGEVEDLRHLADCYYHTIQVQQNRKPWWRYVIS